ncbi:MAG: AMP-binding protein [Eubacteriales bacterium]|nr:AMP-binding protein [Eubacteriales bacterium]
MSLIKTKYPRYLNLRQMIYDAAEKFEDKAYLKYIKGDKSVGEITFRRFSELMENLGTYFAVPENSCGRIAILAENRYEWLVVYTAALAAGKVVIPLDKELDFAQAEKFIELAEADTIVYSADFAEKVVKMAEAGIHSKNIRHYINLDSLDSVTDKRYTTYKRCITFGEEKLASGSFSFKKLRSNSSRVCAIIFTSGTTGTSKGVMLTEDNIMSCIHASANMVNISENDVLLSVLPYHHTYETCCGLLTPICIGITVCINNNLKYFTKNVQLFRPTAIVLVPLFVATMAKKIESEIKKTNKETIVKGGVFITKNINRIGIDVKRYVFASIHKFLGGRLKTIVCGGAALDPQYIKRFEEFGIYISQGYGITECSPLVSVVPWKKVKYASVGIPIPGSTVKIMAEDEKGNEYDLPTGETGEICIKGPQVMAGYYKNPEATAEAFNKEGFFKSGDYGYMDEDGYLFITGRKKNIIIFDNGKNVYPEEIEEYLYRLDIVKECVVVAREIEGVSMITAVIFPDYELFKDKSEEQIKEAFKTEVAKINRSLPSFKQVHHVEIKKTEFEKTSSKKIIRYKV